MDKSWMQLGKCHPDFKRGCDEFIDYAWSHRTPDLGECIFCPCLRCNNVNCLGRDVVREHIRENGITHSYTRWTKHGEPEELVNNIEEEVSNVIGGGDMHGMLQAAFPESRFFSGDGEVPDQANTNGMEYQQNVEQGENSNSETTVVVHRDKKVRGDTTFASFIGKKKEKDKEKEMVDWDMKKDKPCGENQGKYSGVIGVLLKQSRRWNWENPWNLQDDNAKDWLWAEVKDLFAVDELHKRGTLSIAGGIFKDKKSKWKRKHYKLTNTHAVNLKDKPNSLTEGQWKSLVKLWDTEAHQTLSKKNAISRSQQKTKHTMGKKNYSRCEAEMARENGGNPPTDGDVFIKTHINKKSGKALDPFSQGYIAQLREQSGLDEDGLDEDGNQQSISNEVYANVVPTNRHKRIRAQRCHLEYFRNEDFEREKEDREEEFKRQMKERDAEWERRMEAQNEQYNLRQNQMMEYVKWCRPDLFTRSGQLSGPSDHLFRTGEHHHRPWEEQLSIHGSTPFIPLEQRRRPGEQPGIPEEQRFGPSPRYRSREQPSRHGPTHFIPSEPRQRSVEHPGRSEEQPFGHEDPVYRPGEHPNIHRETTFTPLEQRQRPGEHAGRTQELLFGPAEPLYISRDHLSRPQNDCTQGTGTDVWDWIPSSES